MRLKLIDSTLAWVRLAKSDNATAVRRVGKRRSKQVLNSIHKSCKLQNNWFKCDRRGKCHKNTYSPICQTLFSPLTSMRCTKTISRLGMASYRKSLTPHRSMMEMCCSCFMDTKYKCLRCKIPICNQCSVFEENEDVEGWRAGRSVAYCEACDRELKRATQGLTLSEEQSIGSFRSNEKTR